MGWVVSNYLIAGQEPAPIGQRQFHRRAVGRIQDRRRAAQHRRQQAGAVRGARRLIGRGRLAADPRFAAREARKQQPRRADRRRSRPRSAARSAAEWERHPERRRHAGRPRADGAARRWRSPQVEPARAAARPSTTCAGVDRPIDGRRAPASSSAGGDPDGRRAAAAARRAHRRDPAPSSAIRQREIAALRAEGVDMSDKSAEEQSSRRPSAWWTTAIIDIHPGEISVRGYPIQDLIGTIGFPQMIWLMLRGELPTRGQARAARGGAGGVGRSRPAGAVDRDRPHGGHLRPADVNSAMASAINVLGDVHGGAGQQCMELLCGDRRADADAAGRRRAAVDAALDRFIAEHGKIVPGFGHRLHRVDPRAAPLLALVERGARAPATVSGRYAAIGARRRSGARAAQGQADPDEHRRRDRGDLLRARLRAGARARAVHPVALGRHPRPRLGAEAAGRPHQGPDAARPFPITYTGPARAPRSRIRDSTESDMKELDFQPARQVPRGPRRRAHFRPVRPHQHRGAGRARRTAAISSSTRATSRSRRTPPTAMRAPSSKTAVVLSPPRARADQRRRPASPTRRSTRSRWW